MTHVHGSLQILITGRELFRDAYSVITDRRFPSPVLDSRIQVVYSSLTIENRLYILFCLWQNNIIITYSNNNTVKYLTRNDRDEQWALDRCCRQCRMNIGFLIISYFSFISNEEFRSVRQGPSSALSHRRRR